MTSFCCRHDRDLRMCMLCNRLTIFRCCKLGTVQLCAVHQSFELEQPTSVCARVCHCVTSVDQFIHGLEGQETRTLLALSFPRSVQVKL